MASPLAFIQRARALKTQRNQLREERRDRVEKRAQIRRGREVTKLVAPGLIEYVAQLWPELDRFDYFAPYAEILESAIVGPVQWWVAAPPQHGKTEFTLRALLYFARFFPGRRHAYVTFNQVRAREVAELFRNLAAEAGFTTKGTLAIVRLEGGTTVKFTSVQGTLTGSPIDGVFVLDDPIGGQKEALSPTRRKDFERWWVSTARTRRHPRTSYVGMGTRWHVEDPGGYLTSKQGFSYCNLKAIATPRNAGDIGDDGRIISDPLHRFDGEPLWERKPVEFFSKERTDRYWWSAMYQGEPVPLGSSVFAEPGTVNDEGIPVGARFYREIPGTYTAGAFGLDLAYTCKTSADWSICIEGVSVGQDLYIVDVVRRQVEATNFALALKTKASKRPGWKMRWYASGTEKGSGQFIRKLLRKDGADPFRVMVAIGDKFVRSMGVAARWNAGNILLPDPEHFNVPWLVDFLEVVTRFTGQNDEHDDDVDALSALHDQLFHRSRMAEALS